MWAVKWPKGQLETGQEDSRKATRKEATELESQVVASGSLCYYGFWELDVGPLEEQRMPVTDDPSFSFLFFF